MGNLQELIYNKIEKGKIFMTIILILISLLLLTIVILIKNKTRYLRDPMPKEYLEEIEKNKKN